MNPSDARAASRSGIVTTIAVTVGTTRPRSEWPSTSPSQEFTHDRYKPESVSDDSKRMRSGQAEGQPSEKWE